MRCRVLRPGDRPCPPAALDMLGVGLLGCLDLFFHRGELNFQMVPKIFQMRECLFTAHTATAATGGGQTKAMGVTDLAH